MTNEIIKPRSIRVSACTINQLKILCAISDKTQNQVLSELLTKESTDLLVTQQNQSIKQFIKEGL